MLYLQVRGETFSCAISTIDEEEYGRARSRQSETLYNTGDESFVSKGKIEIRGGKNVAEQGKVKSIL